MTRRPTARAGARAPGILVPGVERLVSAFLRMLSTHGLRTMAAPARAATVDRAPSALRSIDVTVAEALVNAMEAKDVYLRGHSQRVAELGAAIARELGLPDETVEAIHLAGRIHDVGKIGIRETVLIKPGSLTPEEHAHIRQHVQIGVDILAPLRHLGEVLDYVHHHHEHVDGSGYPQGLRGVEISLGGRILTAADVFDALTSRRPYREPLSADAAMAMLDGPSGRVIDPVVLDALRRVVARRAVSAAGHGSGT